MRERCAAAEADVRVPLILYERKKAFDSPAMKSSNLQHSVHASRCVWALLGRNAKRIGNLRREGNVRWGERLMSGFARLRPAFLVHGQRSPANNRVSVTERGFDRAIIYVRDVLVHKHSLRICHPVRFSTSLSAGGATHRDSRIFAVAGGGNEVAVGFW